MQETEAKPRFFSSRNGRLLAYEATPGTSPGVVFMGGFMSDMSGTKATSLETFCRKNGHAFLRFDYSGHGLSQGNFADGTISRWTEDTLAVIDACSQGPQVFVGSSMGAWIMILAALQRPEICVGLLGIASAPDFTQRLILPYLGDDQTAQLQNVGRVDLPNPYGDDSYIITRALIEDGQDHLIMGGDIPLNCPVRLVHGLQDADVPAQLSLDLAHRLTSQDVTLTLIKHGEHRLSDLASLSRIYLVLAELIRAAGSQTPQALAASSIDEGMS